MALWYILTWLFTSKPKPQKNISKPTATFSFFFILLIENVVVLRRFLPALMFNGLHTKGGDYMKK
jgi:hypothetical protein